jgi:hypothetical protein
MEHKLAPRYERLGRRYQKSRREPLWDAGRIGRRRCRRLRQRAWVLAWRGPSGACLAEVAEPHRILRRSAKAPALKDGRGCVDVDDDLDWYRVPGAGR